MTSSSPPPAPDISTWDETGHFYFVLTPQPRAALFRSSRSRRSSPEPIYEADKSPYTLPAAIANEADERLETRVRQPWDHPRPSRERNRMAGGLGSAGDRDEWLQVAATTREGEQHAHGAIFAGR